MKILHYSLGFPPYRTGGLTKYCVDLMEEQKRQGDEVSLLWPGKIKKIEENPYIVKRKNKNGFGNFEIINPMPVPLLSGIKEINIFTKHTDKQGYISFLKENSFDVIHLHTLMGLPKEFLEVAKEMGIKTIFTSHDYFGICPKASLLYNERVCSYDKNCRRCEECNKGAASMSKIKIQQGYIYRIAKKSKLLNRLKKFNYKPVRISGNTELNDTKSVKQQKSEPYMFLRKYYQDMFGMVTKMHFNSTTTEKAFREFQVNTPGKMISISHGGIKNLATKRTYSDKIRFGYLGPISVKKGFFLLKNVLDSLDEKYKNKFELHIYSKNSFNCDYIVEHKPYVYSELPQVMDSIDILVLPSIWYETFGFTVLEALSFGVPVMVSENVGAKDIVENNKSGIIFEPTEEDLRTKISEVLNDGTELLKQMNDYICNEQEIKSMKTHACEIREFYTC